MKIEIRSDCAICGGSLPPRFRTYCSTACRNKRNNQKNYKYQRQWGLAKRGEYQEYKLQCLLCGQWYIQVGQHVIQTHKEALIEYKDGFKIPRGHGIIPEWLKSIKHDAVFENETVKNLTKGAKMRYFKGDPRAKMSEGQKGKTYIHTMPDAGASRLEVE